MIHPAGKWRHDFQLIESDFPLFLQGNSTAPGVVVVAGQPRSFMGKYWANKFHIKTAHPV